MQYSIYIYMKTIVWKTCHLHFKNLKLKMPYGLQNSKFWNNKSKQNKTERALFEIHKLINQFNNQNIIAYSTNMTHKWANNKIGHFWPIYTPYVVFYGFLNHNLEWFGGERGICQYEQMRIFVVSRGLALHIANDYRVQMMMLITIVDAIHHPRLTKKKSLNIGIFLARLTKFRLN